MSANRLLSDYKKLGDNEFFFAFLGYIRQKAKYCLEQCGVESYTEDKIRYFQGARKWLELAGSEDEGGLLLSFVSEIRQAIEE